MEALLQLLIQKRLAFQTSHLQTASITHFLAADLPEAVPHECPGKFMCTEDEEYKLLCLDPTKPNRHDGIYIYICSNS